MRVGRTRGRDRARGHSPPVFSPASISGLVGWWDFTTLNLSNTDPISVVSDRSGNSHDATKSNSSAKPTFYVGGINDRAIGSFDGVDDALTGTTSIAANSPMTMVAVIVSNSSGAYKDVFAFGQASSYQEIGIMWDSAGTHLAVGNYAGPSGNKGDCYTSDATTPFLITSVVYEPSSRPQMYKDGTLLTYTSAPTDWSGVNINNGANNYPFAIGAASNGVSYAASVKVAMALVYDRALASSERSLLEHWLGGYFGITVS